jgi:hypothetical protein
VPHSASTSAPAQKAASQAPSPAQLDSVVLHASDLPTGWEDENDGDSAGGGVDISGGADPADIPACSGLAAITTARVAEGDSDDFTSGESGVWSSVASYSSADEVASLRRYLTSPDFIPCMTAIDTKQMQALAPVGVTATVEKATVTPATTHTGVVAIARAVLNITIAAKPMTFYVDTAYIATGWIEATVDFTGVGTPIADTLEDQLIGAVASRAATA